MLFSDTQLRNIRDIYPDDVASSAKELEKKLATYLDPSDTRNFNFVFMPATGFPHIDAFRLLAGETYNPCFSPRASEAALVEYYTDGGAPFKAIFRIGDFVIHIQSRDSGGANVFVNESQVASLPNFDLGSISIRYFENEAFLNLNSRRCIPMGVCKPFDASKISAEVVEGSLCLVQFQALHGRVAQHAQFTGCEESRLVRVENTSPRWVLLWEKQAKFYYHTAHICTQLQQVLRISPHLVTDASTLLRRIHDFQVKAFDCLMAWPYWRPSAAPTPENGQWERNSWANGYFPGAFGLLYGATRAAPQEEVQQKFDAFATRWITHLHPFGGPLYHRFPDHKHWARRSTNHGLVIYFSYLVGASFIRPEGDKWIAHIEAECLKTLRDSLEDGCYLEGLNYLQFILLELLPYVWLRWQRSGISWARFVASRFSVLAGIKDMMLHASRSDGKLFATFGDCDPMEWILTVALFVAASEKEAPGFNLLLENTNPSDAEGNEYLLLARCLPHPVLSEIAPNSVDVSIFEKSGMAAALCPSEKASGWSLWACGSTLHRTHNVDHDCGSFFYETQARPWIVEEKGRSAFMHNVWLVPGVHPLNGEDPLSCHGTLSADGRPLARDNSGTVHKIPDLPEGWDGFQVQAPSIYQTGSDTALIQSAHRSFFFTTDGTQILIVSDQITTGVPDQLRAQFILDGEAHRLSQGAAPRVLDGDRRQIVFPSGGDVALVERMGKHIVHERLIPLDDTRAIGLRAFVGGTDEAYQITPKGDAKDMWIFGAGSQNAVTLDLSDWGVPPVLLTSGGASPKPGKKKQ